MIQCIQTQAKLIRCKDCKYNPHAQRLWCDDDIIYTYAWCGAFMDVFKGEGYCPNAKPTATDISDLKEDVRWP